MMLTRGFVGEDGYSAILATLDEKEKNAVRHPRYSHTRLLTQPSFATVQGSWVCDTSPSRASPCVGIVWIAGDVVGSSSLGCLWVIAVPV
jgi:hypothetical protein